MITLRPYQQRAMDQLLDWFRNNQEGHCIVSACVGSGKSVMLAWLCQHAIAQWPETRIIMLVPNKELLEQNYEKLISIWPDAPVGMERSNLATPLPSRPSAASTSTPPRLAMSTC